MENPRRLMRRPRIEPGTTMFTRPQPELIGQAGMGSDFYPERRDRSR